MHLDSNTLVFSIGILSLLMAFVSWTFPATVTDREFGLREWAVGICCVGFSLILIFLRGQVHPFFGDFLANVFLMAGGTLGLVAPARFFGVRLVWPLVIGALVVGVGGVLAYLLLERSIAFAMVGVCTAMAVVMLYTVMLVLTRARRPIAFSARIFALSMGFMGVAYSVRALLVLLNPQVRDAPASLSGGHQSMLIVGALFVVSSTISFYSMVHDEQKHIIAERARRDPLTGLFNRRAFIEAVEARGSSLGVVSLLMIDIDHFKSINDRFGHLGGDAVLAYAGRLIQSHFRIADLSCRFGGEEFCVMLADCDSTQALARASDLVAAFERQAIDVPGHGAVQVTISAGVCEHRAADSLLHTIGRADEALYRAKHEGRNRALLASQEPASALTGAPVPLS